MRALRDDFECKILVSVVAIEIGFFDKAARARAANCGAVVVACCLGLEAAGCCKSCCQTTMLVISASMFRHTGAPETEIFAKQPKHCRSSSSPVVRRGLFRSRQGRVVCATAYAGEDVDFGNGPLALQRHSRLLHPL